MSKWQKIQPDQIRVGDRVRVKTINQPDAYDFTVFERGATWIGVFATVNHREWYIRKPKKAKPDSELADGHTAHYWRNRYNKQLDHNKQLEASNAGRKVKMQRLEKEAKDARHSEIKWASRYAALAASINELPEEPTPPTRPDEPPVGSFFRVDRTGFEFWRFASMEDGYGYWQISPRSEEPDWERWDDITEPGDTITLLELTEKGDKKDGGV